jgi:hypothetical protein
MPVAQEHQAAQRRATDQRLAPGRQKPRIRHAQPVDILLRRDPRHGPAFVQVLRHGELAQDAVDRRIGIQPVDQGEQIVLGRIGRKLVLEGGHADLDRLPCACGRT